MPTRTATEGKHWKLAIKKVDGRWTVERPKGKVHRGIDGERDPDWIEWTLRADKKKAVSAHFQFAHGDLLEGFTGVDDLTRDLTAVIPEPEGTLTLKIKKDACRRKNPRYYAVWVQDEDLESGGEFAVGEDGNPPPDMEIGP